MTAFIKNLAYINEHCATVIIFLKNFIYHVSDAMDLISCRMFIVESKLIFQHKIFNSIIGFRRLSRSFSKSLDRLGRSDIDRYNVAYSGGFSKVQVFVFGVQARYIMIQSAQLIYSSFVRFSIDYFQAYLIFCLFY